MGRIRRTSDPVRSGAPGRRAAHQPADAVLALQRMAGNRAVGHLLRCKDKAKPKRKTDAQLRAEQMAQKSAPNQTEIAFAHLPDAAKHALTEILAGRPGLFLRPTNDGKHSTDPETGLAKGPGVGVREYHTVPYNESYRLVIRTKGNEKSAYWDSKHTAGTYTYHRITGVPWPAAAPVPAAVPPPRPS